MASAQDSNKFRSNNKVTMFDHDPGGTTAVDIGWVDSRDFNRFVVTTFASALTGAGVTVFKILANPNSDGSGTDVVIKDHAVGTAPDAVGDWLVLECSGEEVAALGSDLRYLSASITVADAADEQVVTYIQCEAKFAEDGLTADVIA